MSYGNMSRKFGNIERNDNKTFYISPLSKHEDRKNASTAPLKHEVQKGVVSLILSTHVFKPAIGWNVSIINI